MNEIELKPMVYKRYDGGEYIKEILASGTYMGVKFAIVSYGTHPCAYVEDIIGCTDELDDMIDSIYVHGGFTFHAQAHWQENADRTVYLGWDYAHFGDYSSWLDRDTTSKRWTTEEIFEEVKDVIKQLKRLKGDKDKMICVEGYKAFRGKMLILPKNGMSAFEVEGDWLYKPEYDCWYCNGCSYAAEICEVVED